MAMLTLCFVAIVTEITNTLKGMLVTVLLKAPNKYINFHPSTLNNIATLTTIFQLYLEQVQLVHNNEFCWLTILMVCYFLNEQNFWQRAHIHFILIKFKLNMLFFSVLLFCYLFNSNLVLVSLDIVHCFLLENIHLVYSDAVFE